MRGRVKPHDPFELIRWLALSQPDPRKALAELVQNSLDAGARNIRVKRFRQRGRVCLSIHDDGDGVIPDMSRSDALKYIATHVGHSRKRQLSPQERLTLMTQGQYGIGLLGFWSLGQTLEMRTSLPRSAPHRLVLNRDKPSYLIEPLRGRLPIDERWTEVLVVDLHREAIGVLGGRRAADYLTSELRGQLLARQVDLVIEDRMARGRAQKIVPVRPPRFLGERLEGLGRVEVPGHPPIRCEIYLAGSGGDDDAARGLAVYCAGTLVADRFDDLASLGLDRPPWTDTRLSGLIDYPGFHVAPGSRRGFVPDEGAGAFARALATIEPLVAAALEALERRRAEELDRTMVRDLQRAFRDFYRQRPRYKMLPVETRKDAGTASGGDTAGSDAGEGAAVGDSQQEQAETPPGSSADDLDLPPEVLLAGPLEGVRLTPSPMRVECRGTRGARAFPHDAAGRPVTGSVSFEWSLDGPVGRLEEDAGRPGRVTFIAGDEPATGTLRVTVRSAPSGESAAGDPDSSSPADDADAAGVCALSAEARVEVVDEITSRHADEGIPEPELVDDPGASWRSRVSDGRWQVNVGHAEYRAVADHPALKLRFLAMLFAKEIVLRSSQDPRLDRPLEQLVEVAAYADRKLASGRRRRGSRSKNNKP